LGLGGYAVAFGVFENSQEASQQSALLEEQGVTVRIVTAGKYLGITRSGKVKQLVDRYVIVLAMCKDEIECSEQLLKYHEKLWFPVKIKGRDYENLKSNLWYLVIGGALARNKAEEKSRELYYSLGELDILRTGFYKGRKKDPLEDIFNQWSKTLVFRKKYQEALKLRGLGDRSLALKSWKECLRIFPEHEISRKALVRLYIELEKWDDAAFELLRLKEVMMDQEIAFFSALVKTKTDPGNARHYYRSFKLEYPNSVYLKSLEKETGDQL
jgi:tetratricopeptide (TPR) repeat protein